MNPGTHEPTVFSQSPSAPVSALPDAPIAAHRVTTAEEGCAPTFAPSMGNEELEIDNAHATSPPASDRYGEHNMCRFTMGWQEISL